MVLPNVKRGVAVTAALTTAFEHPEICCLSIPSVVFVNAELCCGPLHNDPAILFFEVRFSRSGSTPEATGKEKDFHTLIELLHLRIRHLVRRYFSRL